MRKRRSIVSIPFIAGQWSLPVALTARQAWGMSCFNPLHCGAVVASARGPRWRRAGRPSFNPLHCGAVVASIAAMALAAAATVFQSPSLRGSGRFSWGVYFLYTLYTFQSPSLRGSGRFRTVGSWQAVYGGFNPLHCGAVVASRWVSCCHRRWFCVSIPFIAGQWSLHLCSSCFYSLCGVCFNPLHCGAVVAS